VNKDADVYAHKDVHVEVHGDEPSHDKADVTLHAQSEVHIDVHIDVYVPSMHVHTCVFDVYVDVHVYLDVLERVVMHVDVHVHVDEHVYVDEHVRAGCCARCEMSCPSHAYMRTHPHTHIRACA
jgi:hypothetical protein